MNNCNICNESIGKTNSDELAKPWEIWKWERGRRVYEIPMGLESLEKITLPKLVNKHPADYQKLKTMLSKVRKLYKELIKLIEEKQEEVLWKFFYKKGKMLPSFMYSEGHSSTWDICETCSSELESQTKSHQIDEIEGRKIMNKFEEVWNKDELETILSKFSDSEKDEMSKEKEKFEEEFLKSKEKELNNKILAEREREREREQFRQAIQWI